MHFGYQTLLALHCVFKSFGPSYLILYYLLHTWVGYVRVRVFVCLSVQAITFEVFDIETSFLVCLGQV